MNNEQLINEAGEEELEELEEDPCDRTDEYGQPSLDGC